MVTSTLMLRAFRRIPVPVSKVIIQPPGGKTLVNFDTLFRTEAEPFRRTVTLLDSLVELAITPSSFTWNHGDGTTQTTTWAGRAYLQRLPMTSYISHQYEHTSEAYKVSVDTTWSARYRVNGGPWIDVGGTVTRDGGAVNLQVVEGRPTLISN